MGSTGRMMGLGGCGAFGGHKTFHPDDLYLRGYLISEKFNRFLCSLGTRCQRKGFVQHILGEVRIVQKIQREMSRLNTSLGPPQPTFGACGLYDGVHKPQPKFFNALFRNTVLIKHCGRGAE